MFHTTKSQLSVEFIIVIFFAMVIFSFTLYAYFQQSNSVVAKQELFQAKEIVQKIVLNANLAYLDSSTCNTTFYVPTTINSKNYTLRHLPINHILSIEWDNSYYSFPLLNSDLNIDVLSRNAIYVNCSRGISLE